MKKRCEDPSHSKALREMFDEACLISWSFGSSHASLASLLALVI
jgi:hypothetical protein